jgi:hypothetical protein
MSGMNNSYVSNPFHKKLLSTMAKCLKKVDTSRIVEKEITAPASPSTPMVRLDHQLVSVMWSKSPGTFSCLTD